MKGKADVVCRRLGSSAVLVDLETNQIFELNATGYRIWSLMSEGLDARAIGDRLQEEFAIDRTELDREVAELLMRLQQEGLVDESDADAGSG